MNRQPSGRAFERAIVLHELGHLVGLAHVSDQSELMNADNVGHSTMDPATVRVSRDSALYLASDVRSGWSNE